MYFIYINLFIYFAAVFRRMEIVVSSGILLIANRNTIPAKRKTTDNDMMKAALVSTVWHATMRTHEPDVSHTSTVSQ